MNRFLIVALLLTGSAAQAADGELIFTGEFINPPTCIISDNNNIEVDFEDVIIHRIDGASYKLTDVPYTISCTPDEQYDVLAMTLTFLGDQTDFDTAAIKTDINGLGIKLLADGQPFKVGSAINVSNFKNKIPALKAIPVKKPGLDLPAQRFDARATLQVDYQ
ncbi:TPA: fimbrial protein [Salmonella enterica]|nr:fimbrial protein [Salmonella enterica]HED5891401.1 fimbrial protein [Salmonella enterica]